MELDGKKVGSMTQRSPESGMDTGVSWQPWTRVSAPVTAISCRLTVKALENDIPITDPKFYASKESCPDSLIKDIFAPTSDSAEGMPLLAERITIMREIGQVFMEVGVPSGIVCSVIIDCNFLANSRTIISWPFESCQFNKETKWERERAFVKPCRSLLPLF